MTDELRKRIWELIDEFRELGQVAFFLALVPIVKGENLVMPEFVSTESPEGVRELVRMLNVGMDRQFTVMVVERPK
jgi:hypothetical protein